MSSGTVVGRTNDTPIQEERSMTEQTITEKTTHTLEVPGAVLTYDVRRGTGDGPVLLLIGSPMGAAGFGTLAGFFPDRTVVTYDPRGVERSHRTDGAPTTTPEEHADDLSRLIAAIDAGPVDLFASSGGAVNALALVARYPGKVRTLVAHEPPLAALVPDREFALAACRDIHETYQRSGMGAGMATFIAIVTHQGPVTAEYLDRPAPDPAMFGLPTEDDGSRDDVLLGQNLLSCTSFEPDVEALRTAPTRIVVAVGVESDGELASRGGHAVAERLGTPPAVFPSGHGGFLGDEYGQTGQPEPFAARLREVLTAGA
jgi:pimeloyl-ACP methyl ester carboxylesterase